MQQLDIIAVEYPPYTTLKSEGYGIAFELLRLSPKFNERSWKPLFVPPARALNYIESGEWCASFYPVPQNIKSESIILSKDPVKIGLVRAWTGEHFVWDSLEELQGKRIALLRSRESSDFIEQFVNAGMIVIQVETVQAAIQMVLLKRADLAMSDMVTFSNLQMNEKPKLEFSQTEIYSIPITLFMNPLCREK